MTGRVELIEGLLRIERAARLVANGDETAERKLIQAIEEFDAIKVAAAADHDIPWPAITRNQAEVLAR